MGTKSTPTIEAFKELGRVIVLAVISVLLTEGAVNVLVMILAGDSLELEVRLLIVALITAVLRAVDKFMHEKGKVDNNETLERGITQF